MYEYVWWLCVMAIVHGTVTTTMMVAAIWTAYKKIRVLHDAAVVLITSIRRDLDEVDNRLCALVSWAQLARAASKDAEATTSRMAAEMGPVREKIADELIQMSEVTAEKVAQKLSGSGATKAVEGGPPPVGPYPRPPSGPARTV